MEAFALEAILSVNKNEIVKLWREKLMVTVEQHEKGPVLRSLGSKPVQRSRLK